MGFICCLHAVYMPKLTCPARGKCQPGVQSKSQDSQGCVERPCLKHTYTFLRARTRTHTHTGLQLSTAETPRALSSTGQEDCLPTMVNYGAGQQGYPTPLLLTTGSSF